MNAKLNIVFWLGIILAQLSYASEHNDAFTVLSALADPKFDAIFAERAKYDIHAEIAIFAKTYDGSQVPVDGYYVNITKKLDDAGYFTILRKMATAACTEHPRFADNQKYYAEKWETLWPIMAAVQFATPLCEYKVICLINEKKCQEASELLQGMCNARWFLFGYSKSLIKFCVIIRDKFAITDEKLQGTLNRICAL